jgi:hypothetical protein
MQCHDSYGRPEQQTDRVGELTPGGCHRLARRSDKAVGGSVNVAHQQIKREGGRHDDECGVASSDAAAIGRRGALVIGFDVSARGWAKAADRARQLARGFPLFDGVLHTDTASTAAVAD